MKKPGTKSIIVMVSIHHKAGGDFRAWDRVLWPGEAQNQEAASAKAEAAR